LNIIAYDLKEGLPKMGGGKKKNKLWAWGGECGAGSMENGSERRREKGK